MQTFLAKLRRGEVGAAAVLVGGGVLLSRLLGIIRDIVFASMLGADGATDEYVAAFRIPDFANYLLAGGFLAITFIPIMAKYLADDDEDGAWTAFTAITRWLALGISALIALGWFLTPWLIDTLYPDFDAAQVENTIRLTRIVLPAQFAFVVGALFTAVQYTKGAFVIPTIAPIVYNVAIIVGGVGWAVSTGDPSPEGFIWGALVGAFIGNLGLQVWGAHRVGLKIAWTAPWRHGAVITYLTIALPLMLGQSIVALDETFMSVFGATVSDGAATELQFARRTMFVPIGIIGQAAAVAAYPTLARLFAEGKRTEMLALVDRALKYVLVLSIAAAGFAMALATPIIRVLFERAAFGPEATAGTAAALGVYALAIPTWTGLQILTRAFYARTQMWTPVIVGTAATVVAIPLYMVMSDAFGVPGVAMASVISLTLYTLVLAVIWYRPVDARLGLSPVLETAGRAFPLSVPAAFGAAGVAWFITSGLTASPYIAALFALALGSIVYFGLALWIGGTLYDWLWARAKRHAEA